MAAGPTRLSEVELSSFLRAIGQSSPGFRALQFLVMVPAAGLLPLESPSLVSAVPGVLRTPGSQTCLAVVFFLFPLQLADFLRTEDRVRDSG